MKTLFKVDTITSWLDKIKGTERPFAEYHRYIRRAIRRVECLPFKSTTVIRFDSRLVRDKSVFVKSSVTWLQENASGGFKYDPNGPRIYLENEADGALFKLIFIDSNIADFKDEFSC